MRIQQTNNVEAGVETMQDAGSIPVASTYFYWVVIKNAQKQKGTKMSSWLNWFKLLCWTGWHMWEYVYSGKDSQSHRECKRCGAKQVKLQGKWK